MSVTISETTLTAYAFVALFGFIVLRRAYRLTQGVPLRLVRVLVFPALLVVVYVADLAAITYGAAGSTVESQLYASLAVDAALVGVGTFFAYGYALRRVELYRAEGETRWSYRMNAWTQIVYVALFFVRTAIESVVLNLSPFSTPSATQLAAVSPFALFALFAVDALWGVSTGFLIGRNAAVYHLWRQKLAEPASPAGVALP